MIRFVVVMVLASLASPTFAVECKNVTFRDQSYALCEVDAGSEDIRLFLRDPADALYGHFHSLEAMLKQKGQSLSFAMNAGMYHSDRAPVGLYREQKRERQRLITSAGPGNFGLLPNGVFCIGTGRADVFETKRFARQKPECRDASQSGPMLVIEGELHPRFLKDSTSRYIRNGVGTSPDGQRVVFAISNQPVTFYEFGELFRTGLNLPQALYFDGNVSRLHAPDIGRSDLGFRMGPIVGVVTPD